MKRILLTFLLLTCSALKSHGAGITFLNGQVGGSPVTVLNDTNAVGAVTNTDGSIVITNLITSTFTGKVASVQATVQGATNNTALIPQLAGGGALTNYYSSPTFYVATNGIDGIMSTNPFAPGLYGYAHSNVPPNSTVIFLPGVYFGKYASTDASTNNVAWVPFGNLGSVILSNAGSQAIMSVGPSNIISGLIFTGKKTTPSAGILLQHNGGGEIIWGNIFLNSGDGLISGTSVSWPIASTQDSSTNLFEFNHLYNFLDGINIVNTDVYWVVRNNIFEQSIKGSQAICRPVRFDGGDGEAEGNTFINNGCTNSGAVVADIYVATSSRVTLAGNNFSFINSSNGTYAFSLYNNGGTVTTSDIYPSGTTTNISGTTSNVAVNITAVNISVTGPLGSTNLATVTATSAITNYGGIGEFNIGVQVGSFAANGTNLVFLVRANSLGTVSNVYGLVGLRDIAALTTFTNAFGELHCPVGNGDVMTLSNFTVGAGNTLSVTNAHLDNFTQ